MSWRARAAVATKIEAKSESSPELTLALRLVRGETTLREVLGVTHEQMDTRYRAVCSHFEMGNYDEAKRGLTFLTAHEPREATYWIALGGVEQARGEDGAAARAFAIGALLDCDNPAPHLYVAESFAALGNLPAARHAIAACLELSGANDTHTQMVARAVELCTRLGFGGAR